MQTGSNTSGPQSLDAIFQILQGELDFTAVAVDKASLLPPTKGQLLAVSLRLLWPPQDRPREDVPLVLQRATFTGFDEFSDAIVSELMRALARPKFRFVDPNTVSSTKGDDSK